MAPSNMPFQVFRMIISSLRGRRPVRSHAFVNAYPRWSRTRHPAKHQARDATACAREGADGAGRPHDDRMACAQAP